MAEKKSGFKLLYNKVFGIVFFSLIIVSSCGFFIWQNYQQEKLLVTQYLPAIERQQKLSYLIESNKKLLLNLRTSDTTQTFEVAHQLLVSKLIETKQLGQYSRSFFVFLNNDELENLSIRIANNEVRNQAITQDVLVLIKEINHSMIDLIAVMSDRQANLYDQVLADKVSDRVTASRAIAHTNVSHDIQAYQDANRYLNQIADVLETLSYLSSTLDIDSIELSAEKFGQWKGVYQDQLQAENDDLSVQLNLLTNALFGELRLIAKWRGQVRLATEYLESLLQQESKLQALEKLNQNPVAQPESQLKLMVNDLGVKITAQQLYLGLVIVVSLSLLAIVLLLLRMLKRVKVIDDETCELVMTLTAENEGLDERTAVANTKNQQIIYEQLCHIIQPEHNEEAYQLQLKNIRDMQQVLLHQGLLLITPNEHGHFIDIKQQDIDWLNNVTNRQFNTYTSWRRYFSTDQCKVIIEQLRLLNSQPNTSCVIDLDEATQLKLTFYKLINSLFVILQDTSVSHQREAELKGHVYQLQQDEQKQWQGEQQIFNHIQRKLIQSSLSQQSVKRNDKSSLRHAQQLSQQIQWSEGGRLWSTTHLANVTVNLSPVNLGKTLSALVSNAQLKSPIEQKLIFEHLAFDQLALSNLNVLMDLPAFHYVMKNLLDIQFNKQQGDLIVDTQVVEQNAGRLVVKYKFIYQQKLALSSLPAAMLLVSHQVESQPKTSTFEQGYFTRALLDYLHVDNIDLVQKSHGWQFSFELPHATQENVEKVKSQSLPKLNSRIVVIIKEESNRKWLEALLKPVSSDVVAVSSLEHASSFIDVGRLEKQKIGLIISANEQGHHDARQINMLVQQLPERLQPKVFIFNGATQLPLSQYDTYSHSINMRMGFSLLTALNEFLTSNKQDNLCYQHTQLQPYNTMKSTVSVLLACEALDNDQPLASLLSWLGFDVTLMNNVEQATYAWQQGNYRLLVTDMPIDDVSTVVFKRQIKRCVISLSEHLFKATDTIETHQISAQADAEQWASLLRPWLAFVPTNKNQATRREQIQKSKEAFDNNSLLEVRFDIEKYASNVGGAELAALMIDDYVENLNNEADKLNYALTVKSAENAQKAALELQRVSRIIASKELYTWSTQLLHCIEQQAFSDGSHLMPEIKRDIESLKDYVESI